MLDQAAKRDAAGLVRTGVTFASACEEYLRYLEHDRERCDYRSIIAAHLTPTFGEMAVEDLTADPARHRTKVKILTILHTVCGGMILDPLAGTLN